MLDLCRCLKVPQLKHHLDLSYNPMINQDAALSVMASL